MTGTTGRRGSLTGKVMLLSVGLSVLAVCLLAITPAPLRPLAPTAWWVWVLVSVGFFLAERYVFHVEYRRQVVNFSISEVPAVFALIFLSPVAAVVARLIGSLLAKFAKRGLVPLKDFFNAGLFAADIALAGLLVRALVNSDTSDAALLVISGGALLVASAFSTVITSVVVSVHEGRVLHQLRMHFFSSGGIPFLGPVLGATALTAALIHPALFALPLVPILFVWWLLRAHGRLSQRHRDLAALHDFSGAVNRSLHLTAVMQDAQNEIERLLRARFTQVVVFRGDAFEPLAVASTQDARPVAEETWQPVLTASGGADVSRFTAGGGPMANVLTRHGWRDLLAAPLRDNEGLIGLLLVADRVGAQAYFSPDDASRMRSLADQLTVSLRKSLLHIRLEHDATHDRLTGLPNRGLFERSITEALRAGGSVAVLLLDLDRFKEVNDGLGHHIGDVLLRKFADRVVSVVGPGAVVSRLAGDEFAIMASGMTRHQAGELGSRILAAARELFDLGELSVAVSCSIGLAMGPAHGEDATTLLRRADLAMYEAKGRSGGVSVYRGDLETTSTQRLRLLQDLRVAAVDEQMQAWFQPKVHLRTNAVVGVETLVRWHHPDQGVLEADRFIGLAEQTDLIHTITDRMLTSALTTARSWRRRGWALGVAVNVSARSLLDELLADRIARHLHQHDVPAEMLTIEITETSVMADVSRALVTLDRLSDLGVQLSVDDYGTGYSSLTYLRKLPVSELKIDRGFIATMLTDEHDEVIVRSTIDLGRHLGLRVVAEGIESPEIADRLRDLGCDIGQGAGFAAPLPADQLERWLEDGPYLVPGADGEPGALATA